MAKQTAAVKGGLMRAAAIAAAMVVAKKATGRWMSKARKMGVADDILSAAYEGIVHAWETWEAEQSGWEAHAYRWADAYAAREMDKHHSIVQSNYSRHDKRSAGDTGLVNDDGTAMDLTDDGSVASQCETRMDASRLYRVYAEKVRPTLDGAAAAMADDLMTGEEAAGTVAQKHGYSRLTGYRAEERIHAALRAAVGVDAE